MTYTHVLDGVTVLDFTQFIAGPACTRLMAEMGADVIKIEMAPNGDLCRVLPELREGRSAYFVQHNQGKQSVCVDIRKPEAVDLLKGLIAQADVVIENFSPGVIDRLGLGWDVVHAINPRAIMCSISAFGQSGPLRDLPGFDYIAQAVAGVTSMIGEPDKAPPVAGLAVGDIGTAITSLAAINAALFHRERTGGDGQYLDISLLDFYFHAHELNVQSYTMTRGATQPTRNGSHHPLVAPLGIFKAPEGFIVIIALGDQWQRLCRAMNMEELMNDPRFVDGTDRLANREALAAIIEGWLQTFKTDRAVLDALEKARVPCAPVLTVAEAVEHPHLIERGTIRRIEDRGVGSFGIPRSPLRFSDFPEELDLTAPFMGEHNAQVLSERLGKSASEIERLSADGVLQSRHI
ncbi:CaiB/BaiF CoA transferase family protein [Minwuia sp.]|uniref:CaiB/BaiF CoA transferase family protein n=1 Tax=Minwuia sp. TaxID=2493630 RepID=UPI003A8E7B6F